MEELLKKSFETTPLNNTTNRFKKVFNLVGYILHFLVDHGMVACWANWRRRKWYNLREACYKTGNIITTLENNGLSTCYEELNYSLLGCSLTHSKDFPLASFVEWWHNVRFVCFISILLTTLTLLFSMVSSWMLYFR